MLKEYEQPETEAMLYGTMFHEAAEFYLRDRVELPEKFNYARSLLDRLAQIPGNKLCEYKMGVTDELEACAFDDDEVWFRGISDLSIINEEKSKAHVFDYKTGKSAKYADTGQLELMALATFAHFPKINTVKAALLFVVSNEIVDGKYTREQVPALWAKWLKKFATFEAAHENNVWNANPSGLCRRHCPVLSCPHNGRSQ